jgi:hypothetical protein
VLLAHIDELDLGKRTAAHTPRERGERVLFLGRVTQALRRRRGRSKQHGEILVAAAHE